MLPALATTSDASVFGLTTDAASLMRASTRLRSFLGQTITSDTSTVTLRGPVNRLPQRPVNSVTSVTDKDGNVLTADEWTLGPAGTLTVPGHSDLLTVVYTHGYATVPDGVVELVCTIAARLYGTDPTVATGVQQEQSGSASQTFGWDAWKGVSSLTTEEKATARRLFPKLPSIVAMRA